MGELWRDRPDSFYVLDRDAFQNVKCHVGKNAVGVFGSIQPVSATVGRVYEYFRAPDNDGVFCDCYIGKAG
jgi:hypothetical protein